MLAPVKCNVYYENYQKWRKVKKNKFYLFVWGMEDLMMIPSSQTRNMFLLFDSYIVILRIKPNECSVWQAAKNKTLQRF